MCQSELRWVVWWAKTENYFIFSIPEDTQLTLKLVFGCLHWDIFEVFFAFVLVSLSLIQGLRVKGTLSIKILVLCHPELEFCGLRKAKRNSKPKILYK